MTRFVLTLKGTDRYGQFLDDLVRASGASDRSDLAEGALAQLARKLGMTPPPRVTPAGWSRRPKRKTST